MHVHAVEKAERYGGMTVGGGKPKGHHVHLKEKSKDGEPASELHLHGVSAADVKHFHVGQKHRVHVEPMGDEGANPAAGL
jgi:hypothetical protein